MSRAVRSASWRRLPLLALFGFVLAVIALMPLKGGQQVYAAEVSDGSDIQEAFRAANALYAEGEFAEAGAIYQGITEGGFGDADVLYNLGNAWYKSGSVGRAVLSYERALKVAPGHTDARANLEFVRAGLADRPGRVATIGIVGVLERTWSELDPVMLVVFVSLIYALLIAVVVIGIVRGGMAGWPLGLSLALLALLVLVGTAAGTKIYRLHGVHEGVVIVRETGVRTGPGEEFVLEFRLHEGTKVRLSEQRGGWTRVSVLGTDLEGWLPVGALEAI